MSLTPICRDTGGAAAVFPVKIANSALLESGYSSTGAVAVDCTIALGFKPTAATTAPLNDMTGHYLLTIQKQGTTVRVWKQGVELANFAGSVGATYAEFLSNVLAAYCGSNKGYYSRLVVVEQVLNYSDFWEPSDLVTGLWTPKELALSAFALAPSYDNADGKGDRTASITATASTGLFDLGSISNMIDGSQADASYFVSQAAAAGKYMRFAFSSPRKITEAKWYQANTHTHGVWKWQGSNNGVDWADISADFTFGNGSNSFTLGDLSGNSAFYSHYQMVGVSGQVSAGPFLRELEFKIADATAHTYGPNGCHLDFADAGDLGNDVSGNNNDWGVSGPPVQVVDTPTDNACTLNGLDPNAGALSNGNLTLASGTAKPTLQPESGKWSYKKDGVEQLYDADVSGKFDPDLAAGTYEFLGYSPTVGYELLSSSNMPNPTILKSSTVADLVIRVGTGAEAAITSLDMQPDFVNMKNRDGVMDWQLCDAERGANNILFTNLSNASTVQADKLTAFNSDGYTLGSSIYVNQNGSSFLDLCLKAGTNQGFEIVTYTGNASLGRVINHSLGKAPTFIIAKRINSPGGDWIIYHKATGRRNYLKFTTSAVIPDSNVWYADPDATSFYPGSTLANESGGSYMAYLFTDSDIFKAWSATGNASNDGYFANIGGKPLWNMAMNADAAQNWVETDAVRNTYNPVATVLYPNTNDAEVAGSSLWAYTSQGMKMQASGALLNGSGNLIVGLAILESTKYSNAC